MGIGRGDVDFFNITVWVGAGVLLVAQMVFAAFFNPARVFVFARGGVFADVAVFIDFKGLALCTAGGVNDGGIHNGSFGFFYFERFFSQLLIDVVQQLFQDVVLGQLVAKAA